MGFPRQEHRSGLSFSSLGDLPDPGIKPTSPALAGGFFTTEPPGKPVCGNCLWKGKVLHSRILAWEIPWTEEPGGLQSTESHNLVIKQQ